MSACLLAWCAGCGGRPELDGLTTARSHLEQGLDVEALALFEAAPESFDLIITDQTMPGMSGVDMVREIRTLNSDVPVVVLSGYADVVSEQIKTELQIADVLLKPVMAEELERVIGRALQSG